MVYLKLVKDGFVMLVGFLVVGKNGLLIMVEFGDVVGVMIIWIVDLVYLLMWKYIFVLMKND